jgi:hypothetical protein
LILASTNGPGTSARDVRRHPGALTFPGLLIWRAGGDRREVQIKYGRALKAAKYNTPRRIDRACYSSGLPRPLKASEFRRTATPHKDFVFLMAAKSPD